MAQRPIYPIPVTRKGTIQPKSRVQFVYISPTATTVGIVSLASANTPVTQTAHKLYIRARKTSGSGTVTLTAALYEGANNRSGDLTTSALTTSLTTYELAISDVNADTITDYSNLEVRFQGNSPTGDSTSIEIAEISLEIPAGAASHERSAALSATAAIASLAIEIIPRAIVISAAASISTSSIKVSLRSSALNATSAIQSSAVGFTTFERSAAIAATGTIASSGIRVAVRAFTFSATASIDSSGIGFTLLEAASTVSATALITSSAIEILPRSSIVSATSNIVSVPQRDLLRSTDISASSSIASSGRETLERSVSLSATSTIESQATFFSIFDRQVVIGATSNIISDGRIAGQILRPFADSVDGGWLNELGGTDLVGSIDESLANDTDYIESPDPPSTTRFKLSEGETPVPGTKTLRTRAEGVGGPVTLTVRLYEGGGDTLGAGTEVDEFVHPGVETLEQFNDTVTGSVVDWTNLYVELEVTA